MEDKDQYARYNELMVSSVSNASLMSMKIGDWTTVESQAKFARHWTDKAAQPEKYTKLTYRMAVAQNGLGNHEEAMKLLKEVVSGSKDKAVREEYEKTKKILQEATEKQKQELGGMFDKGNAAEAKKETKKDAKKEAKKEKAKPATAVTKPRNKALLYVGLGAIALGAGYLLLRKKDK